MTAATHAEQYADDCAEFAHLLSQVKPGELADVFRGVWAILVENTPSEALEAAVGRALEKTRVRH